MKSLMSRLSLVGLLLLSVLCWMSRSEKTLALGNGQLPGASKASFFGSTPGGYAGWSVDGAGDVNGDGYADILVGMSGFGSAVPGAAFLQLGGPTGWGLEKDLEQAPILKYSGENVGELTGGSVAGVGDVNGDGYDDFLVGAQNQNSDVGAAYLVLGSAAPTSAALITHFKFRGQANDFAGISVAGAGDVNGDGFDDMLVGAAGNNGNTGAAYLVLGSATPGNINLSSAIKYSGLTAGDYAGLSVAGAGDVNGDGYADMLIGAQGVNSSTGAAYLVLGSAAPASASLATSITYSGVNAGDSAGTAVAGAGDVNGDGYADLLVSAYRVGNDVGRAYLILGGPSLATTSLTSAIAYEGEADDDNAGYSVSGAGDVNGDGFADFLVGAYGNGYQSNAGTAYLVLGSANPAGDSLPLINLATAIKYSGVAANNLAGWSVAGAGDVDGDGYADFLVGVPRFNTYGGGTNFAGAAYLITSDALSPANPVYRQRQTLLANGNLLPVTFEQAGVRVDFTGGALAGGDISVNRYAFHPCGTDKKLTMPIWDVESPKLNPGTSQVSLRFKYNDDQIVDMVEANLKLWMRPQGQPCTAWVEVAGSTVDTAHNFVTVTGLTGLGQFTIAESTPSPTALTDVSFMAQVAQSPLPFSLSMVAALALIGGTLRFIRRPSDLELVIRGEERG